MAPGIATPSNSPGTPVVLSFLEFMSPDLVAGGEQLVAAGCQRVHVLPLFLGTGGHVRRDIPPLLDSLRELGFTSEIVPSHFSVKEAVFPFARFPGVDTVLGPEMRSTGEVIGLDRSFEVAFAKSQLGGGTKVPTSGTVFVSVRDADKPRVLPTMKMLSELGFKIVATGGTQRFLEQEAG